MNKYQGFFGLIIFFCLQAKAQTRTPDLQDKSLWTVYNRSAENIDENGKKRHSIR
jgi:hypothetical protein